MTGHHLHRPVVIGIDGGDDGDRAMRYGVEEACRRGVGVRLVHVPPDLVTTAPLSPLYQMTDTREIGRRVLDDAIHRFFGLDVDVPMEGSLGQGSRTHVLLEESERASCLVLGTREWHKLRAFGGSTSVAVAARAAVPVVAVPPTWNSTPSSGRVIVGVDDHGGPLPVLRRAFAAAEERYAELVVVHAWAPPSPYEPALVHVDRQGWRKLAGERLDDLIAEVRSSHPDVAVTSAVVLDSTSAALLETATADDVLVVGRHRTHVPFPHRLGSVARHAIHAGMCPVEVVPISTD